MSSARQAFACGRIFDGSDFRENSALLVADGRVVDVVAADQVPADCDRVDLNGGTLVPGFVDLQVNGGGGVMFNDAPNVETLRMMADAHLSLGTTSFLPTLITDTPEITRAAIGAAAEAIEQGVEGVAGLHLEGPHLSVARKGAHDPHLIRPMGEEDLALLLDAKRRLPVLFVTLAPENASFEQMHRLSQAGIILSLGHSDCSFDTASAAAAQGVRCVTHLYNAMSQIGNREPGMVGAALARPELSAGLIADLVHVHPEAIRIALAAKTGPGRIFLVTDAMAPAGSDISEFTLNGRVIRREGGRLTLADGTLAGADLDLSTAIRNLVGLDVPEKDAVAMATSVPAAVIDATDEIGSLRKGCRADMVLLDTAGAVRAVWRGGAAVPL